MRYVGWDFGTTNSAVAICDDAGPPRLARFPHQGALLEVFRSLLYFPPVDTVQQVVPAATAGPEAIDAYLSDEDGRLIQSLKSFLASGSFERTQVFGRTLSCEDLLSLILMRLRRAAEAHLGPLGHRAVVGRPVTFAGGTGDAAAAEARAVGRLRASMARAGFTDVVLEYEPVGAACLYAAGDARRELVVVADFGGGTSDFCVMALEAGEPRILATAGAPIAGDVFDGRIVRAVVAPALGLGSRYRPDGRPIEVPRWIYGRLERWHHLSFLRDRQTLQLLVGIAATSEAPRRIQGLLHLVRCGLGFHLFRAVEATKIALSSAEETRLRFVDGPVEIDVRVTRSDFEGWIAADVARITESLDAALATAGVAPAAVDRVYLTGGTSLVPAVRRHFEARFGATRLVTGDHFTSVVVGLAHRARQLGVG